MTLRTTRLLITPIILGLTLTLNTSVASQTTDVAPLVPPNPCEVHLAVGDTLRFSQTQIDVPQNCERFTVELEHIGRLPKTATPQNWVLTTRPYLETVARAAYRAGEINHWTAPNSEHILAATPLIGRGETTRVILDVSSLDTETDYRFLSTVGGHSPRMRGTLRVVPTP
ncbi:plastocyanin/azurin family copper-binding protein [Orrella sp. 11846]|uniref:plastocyanin/azurin family copper-binding protein n=1 Tax=Orrella sp. 11846 TaxID=3409913 RepID=UPI003B5B7D3B